MSIAVHVLLWRRWRGRGGRERGSRGRSIARPAAPCDDGIILLLCTTVHNAVSAFKILHITHDYLSSSRHISHESGTCTSRARRLDGWPLPSHEESPHHESPHEESPHEESIP